MDDLSVLATDMPLPDDDEFKAKIGPRFNGILNEANLAPVAELMSRIFTGRKVAIATCHFCDHGADNRLKLVTDQEFYADWTNGSDDIIQYHHIGDEYTPLGKSACEPYTWASLSFQAGGYLWSMEAAPGNNHDHKGYRYCYVDFSHDRSVPSMQFISKAPADHIHKCSFTVQGMFDE